MNFTRGAASRWTFRLLHLRQGSVTTLARGFCGRNLQEPIRSATDPQAEPQNADQSKTQRVRGANSTSKYDDIKLLTKWDLSLLNTTVALAGYALVPGVDFFTLQTISFAAATQLMAMASQGANQVIEKDLDKQMVRTCMRPLPRDRLSTEQAKLLTLGLWAGSNLLFLSTLPWSAAAVANTVLFSYVLVYTPMKRVSTWNTAVGALVGALPPLIGWAAAGGSMLAMQPWAIILFMFSWQFPHFFGILWTYRADYDKANYVMVKNPLEAAVTMKRAVHGMMLSGLLLLGASGFSVTGAALLAYYLYSGSMKAINTFSTDPSVTNAKNLKRSVYIPFTVFFVVILLKILGCTPEELISRVLAKKGATEQAANPATSTKSSKAA